MICTAGGSTSPFAHQFFLVCDNVIFLLFFQDHVKASQSKDESLKVMEDERDFLKKQLAELRRHADSTQEDLKATLKKREEQLQDITENHRKALVEVEQLKGQLNQKEGEIVAVRTQLQEYAFAKARESAEQLNKDSKGTKTVDENLDEVKPADEAGIADRSKLQEEEELQLKKETESLAVEKEMDERSKPTVTDEKSGDGHDDQIENPNQEQQVGDAKQETQNKADRDTADEDRIELAVKDENKDILQDEETSTLR